jgi:serine/threonine-protein kinase
MEGRTLGGKYRVVRAIGRGGTGEVFEAERLGTGERVAIKVLDREWAKDDVVAGRFAREARAASAVASEHIVRVLDGGTEDGCPYLVMELLPGEDLGTRLRRAWRVPLGEALEVTRQVLRGLAAAHAAGVVHRDLKPDNVILVEGAPAGHGVGGRPYAKIVDFGMSKIDRPAGRTAPLALTRKGVVLGTPLYMSPEQARASQDVDRRADLYSVGAILFECLAGRPPHVGETYEQILLAICMEDAPDVRRWARDVPDQVAAVLGKALAREKEDRFQTAEEMLAAVDVARADAMKPRDEAAERRRARMRLITTAVVATIAGAVVMLLVLAAIRMQAP